MATVRAIRTSSSASSDSCWEIVDTISSRRVSSPMECNTSAHCSQLDLGKKHSYRVHLHRVFFFLLTIRTVSGYMIFTTTIEGQTLFAIPCNLLRIPSVFVLASGLRFGSEIIMTTVLLLISTSVTFWMVPDELFHVYAFLPSPSLCVEGPADFSASVLLSSSAVISAPLILDS